jgi:hypothetical protein
VQGRSTKAPRIYRTSSYSNSREFPYRGTLLFGRRRGKRIALVEKRPPGQRKSLSPVRDQISLQQELAPTNPMLVFVIVNKNTNAKAIVNHGCCTNCLIAEKLVRKLELKRTPIRLIEVEGVNGQKSVINAITWFDLDISSVR